MAPAPEEDRSSSSSSSSSPVVSLCVCVNEADFLIKRQIFFCLFMFAGSNACKLACYCCGGHVVQRAEREGGENNKREINYSAECSQKRGVECPTPRALLTSFLDGVTDDKSV